MSVGLWIMSVARKSRQGAGPLASSRKTLMAGTALTAALLAVGLTPGVSSAQVVISTGEIVDGTDPTGSGPGSRPSPWAVNGNLWVDNGSLSIRAGGVVFSHEGRIANNLDTVGAVLVTGAGSRWENSGRLIVGNLGSGALTIANGATVANTDGYIGASSGSSTVTVRGAGSRWDSSGRLVIGNSGDGILTISDGAVVSADAGVELGNFGGAAVLNIGASSSDPGDAIAAGFLDAARIRAIAGTATINFNHTGTDYEFTPVIEGIVTLNHYAGATTLSANSLYTGATNLFGGVLTVAHPNALGESVLTASGGVLNLQTPTFSNTMILAGEVDLNVAAGLSAQYAGGAISEDQVGRGFSKTGGGELLLLGTHTFTGDVRVEEGVLALMGGAVLSDTVGIVVEAPGTLRLDTSETIDSLAGAGSIALGSSTLTIAGAASTTYSGVMSGTGGLVKRGTGTLTLAGANTWGGSTVVRQGVLAFDGGSATSGSAVVVGDQAGDDGSLFIDNGGVVSSGGGTIGRLAGSTGSIVVDGAGSAWTNSGALVVGGSGAGVLTLSDGGLASASSLTLGANAGASGLLNIGAADGDAAAAAGLLDVGTITFGDGGGAIVFNHTDTDFELDADISGAGTIWILAGWTLLSGDNSYTGTTRLEGGTLSLGSDTALGASTLTTFGSVVDYLDGVNIANSVVIDSTTTQFQVLTGSATHSGVISETNGPRPFEKIGEGELILTADNLWTGLTRVSAGTLTFNGGSLDLVGRLTASASGAPTASIIARNGARIATASNLIIGEVDHGEMTIESGAEVTAASLVSIADVAGSSGLLTIQGPGSRLTADGGVSVGTNDAGALRLTDGGRIVSTDAYIGFLGTASGAAHVSGANTQWINSGPFFFVGYEGVGALTVADGALVEASSIYLADRSTASGTLTIGDGAGAGILRIGDDTISSGLGAATVRFNHTDLDYVFSSDGTDAGRYNVIVGGVAVEHVGAGTTVLGGAQTYTGATSVTAGSLMVNGSLANTGGLTVRAGGALGGAGVIGGLTTIENGGTLVGEAGSVLTLGSLTLGSGSVLDVTLGAPAADAVFDVTGDLVLDGVLDVTDGGGFGAGVYGLITYGGVLTDNGLVMGDLPVGYSANRLEVQTSVAGRVNLVNTGLADLLFWDGGDPSKADNGAIDGGAGTWTRTSATWTDVGGASNGAMVPAPGLAVFMGAGGTVTLDASAGALSVTGLQFAADGYSLTGDSLTLVEETPGAGVNLRVGDGTAAGADWTAVIDSDLSGAVRLRKTDLGTLILTGDSSHTGGTEIAHGELRIGDGGTTGSLTGGVANQGLLTFDRADDVSFGGVVSGTGALVQAGGGVLRLTGANTYTGATRVQAGTLDVASAFDRLSDQTALGVAAGATFELGTTFQDVGSFAGQGVISGTGGTLNAGTDDRSTAFSGSLLVSTVNLSGTGTLTLSGGHAVDTLRIANTVRIGAGGWSDLTGTGGPLVQMSGGLLNLDGYALLIETLEDLGRPGSLNLGDGGVLTLSDGRTAFRGLISGAGEIIKDGANDFTLAGEVAYDGDLTILDGGIVLGAAATLTGDLVVAVNTGARFDLNGTDQRLVGLSGAGRVDLGAGALELALGDAAFGGDFAGTGDITLSDGVLGLNGDSSAFAGTLTVADGATLRGAGVIGGVTTVETGGVLSGRQGQTLGLGALVLSEGATVATALGAADGAAALFDVAGDLTLDGQLAVTNLGGFGAGVYRLFNYGGELTDLGLDVASAPDGVDLDDLYVQTAVDHQVNLVSTYDVELRFWDGGGAADDGAIQGGAGTWSLGGREWTGANGAVNGVYDNPAFAVFMGTGGAVSVDGAGIGVTGLQFAVDGYQINGAGIELTEDETIVRVGDGTAAGAGMTTTIGSVLTGAGRLVKSDLGTLVLTGGNSYTGGTYVQAGTLVGSTTSIRGDIVNEGVVRLNQSAAWADVDGTTSGSGEYIKTGAGGLRLVGSSTSDWTIEQGGLTVVGGFSGDVATTAGAVLTFDQSNGARTWGGVLSGAGTMNIVGSERVRLTGQSQDFTGNTIVFGWLSVDGRLGGTLEVAQGGRLQGSGRVGSLTVAGTINPGNSIGTLQVDGDLTFLAGSVFEVEVNPQGQSDRINVLGSANLLGGSVLSLGSGGNYAPRTAYTILTAAGGVNGQFGSVASDLAFLDATLDYTAASVVLTLTRNDIDFAAVAWTPNQRATAPAVEALGLGNDIWDAVLTLSAGDARLAFDQLSGDAWGSVGAAQIEDSRLVRDAFVDRLNEEAARGAWIKAHGLSAEHDTDLNAGGFDRDLTGVVMGADATLLNGWRVGVGGGYATSDYAVDSRGLTADGEVWSLGAYAGQSRDAMRLSAGLAWSWQSTDVARAVVFPGFGELNRAGVSGQLGQAFAEVSWILPYENAVTVEPYVGAAFIHWSQDGFNETGGASALTVDAGEADLGLIRLGARASGGYRMKGRDLRMSARAGLRRMVGDTDVTPAMHLGGQSLDGVRGLSVPGIAAEIGLSAEVQLRQGLVVSVSAQALASERNADAGATVQASWRF